MKIKKKRKDEEENTREQVQLPKAPYGADICQNDHISVLRDRGNRAGKRERERERKGCGEKLVAGRNETVTSSLTMHQVYVIIIKSGTGEDGAVGVERGAGDRGRAIMV